MNPSLAEIQTAFQNRILAGSDELLPMLGGGNFVGVYEHAYLARLLEVLAEDFPALHTLLGDEAFAEAMHSYLAAHPSRHRSVRWLGSDLATWLAAVDPWSGHPVLADMADFEWALGLAFDAPDAPAVGADDLAAISPEAWHVLGFTFHPSLRRVSLAWDVEPFRKAVVDDRDPDAAPEPLDPPGTWAVWRDSESLIVHYDRLPPDEAEALAAARAGAAFGTLCELMAEMGGPDDAAFRGARMLQGWVGRGWISGLAGNNASWG